MISISARIQKSMVHSCGKSDDWPVDRQRTLISRLAFREYIHNYSSAATKFSDTSGNHAGTSFGCRLPPRIFHSRRALETFLASRCWQQGQHLQSHSTLPCRHLPELPATNTGRRSSKMLDGQTHCRYSH